MGMMIDNIELLRKSVISNNKNVFQILEYINAGKNGAVFKVYCINGKLRGGIFALKVQYNLKEKRLTRFYREVEFLKTHNSSTMVKYCDDGIIKLSNETYPFVVMPYYKYSLETFVVSSCVCILVLAIGLVFEVNKSIRKSSDKRRVKCRYKKAFYQILIMSASLLFLIPCCMATFKYKLESPVIVLSDDMWERIYEAEQAMIEADKEKSASREQPPISFNSRMTEKIRS